MRCAFEYQICWNSSNEDSKTTEKTNFFLRARKPFSSILQPLKCRSRLLPVVYTCLRKHTVCNSPVHPKVSTRRESKVTISGEQFAESGASLLCAPGVKTRVTQSSSAAAEYCMRCVYTERRRVHPFSHNFP